MKTPDNSIDFTEASPEDIKKAQEISPADHAKNLEAKFGTSVQGGVERSKEDIRKKEVLLENLSKSLEKPKEFKSEKEKLKELEDLFPEDTPITHTSNPHHMGGQPKSTHKKSPSDIALEIHTDKPSTGLKAATGALIVGTPALGLLMASVAAPAAAFALPAVGAGIAAYGVYKMFKTWKAKREFKKKHGETVDQMLGHDF